MYDERSDSESITTLELVGQSRPRLAQVVGVGGSQVDQIAGVGHQRAYSTLLVTLSELLQIGLIEGFPLPLTGILDKHLDRIATEIYAAIDSAAHAASDRDMGTEGRRHDRQLSFHSRAQWGWPSWLG